MLFRSPVPYHSYGSPHLFAVRRGIALDSSPLRGAFAFFVYAICLIVRLYNTKTLCANTHEKTNERIRCSLSSPGSKPEVFPFTLIKQEKPKQEAANKTPKNFPVFSVDKPPVLAYTHSNKILLSFMSIISELNI